MQKTNHKTLMHIGHFACPKLHVEIWFKLACVAALILLWLTFCRHYAFCYSEIHLFLCGTSWFVCIFDIDGFHFIFIRPQNNVLHALSTSYAFWQTPGSCLPPLKNSSFRPICVIAKSYEIPHWLLLFYKIFPHSWRALQINQISQYLSLVGQQPFAKSVLTLSS